MANNDDTVWIPRGRGLKDLIPKQGDTDFQIIKDHDYWWKQRGLCPKCKDTQPPPECMPGGWFKCKKCGWNNNK